MLKNLMLKIKKSINLMLKNFKKFNAKKFYIKNLCKKTKNFDLGLGSDSRSRFSVFLPSVKHYSLLKIFFK